MKKNVIRVGDRVRVINPEMVIRVGYEFTTQDARKYCDEKFAPEILKFMESIGMHNSYRLTELSLKFDDRVKESKLYRGILNAVAYAEVGKRISCGNERKIYTEPRPYLTDMEFRVHQKKVVRTGNYFPSSGGYDSYTGEYDYECGGLSKPKTHIILNLTSDDEIQPYKVPLYYMAIESCNVEKIND